MFRRILILLLVFWSFASVYSLNDSIDWVVTDNSADTFANSYAPFSLRGYNGDLYFGFSSGGFLSMDQWDFRKFSSSGIELWDQQEDFTGYPDSLTDIAVDNTGVYLVGPQTVLTAIYFQTSWRLEKRDLDGNYINSWNIDTGANFNDRPNNIYLDSTGIYIVGVDNTYSVPSWRIEKRSKVDPAIILWVKHSSFSSNQNVAEDIVGDSNSVYIKGYDFMNSDVSLQARSKITGNNVWNFSTSNIMESSLLLMPDGFMYVLGDDFFGVGKRLLKIDKTSGNIVDYSPILPNYFCGFYGCELKSAPGSNKIFFGMLTSVFPLGDIKFILYDTISNSYEEIDLNSTSQIVYFLDYEPISDTEFYLFGRNTGLSNGGIGYIEKHTLVGPSTDIDCGYRVFDGTANIAIACEPLGTLTSPLRFSKGSDVYGIVLVDVTDSAASKIRIQTSSGVKSLKKFGVSSGPSWAKESPILSAQYHSCVLLNSGNVHCWGRNNWGQSNDYNSGDVISLALGAMNHNCALRSNGNVHCWGSNDAGQSSDYTGGDAIAISSGSRHNCALLSSGNVHCWGSNYDGQSNDYLGGDAVAISSGQNHNCALLSSGNVHCWGWNTLGQSNDYTSGGNIMSLISGRVHNCILFDTGNVHCWGNNNYGQSNNYLGGDAIGISAGGYTTCILLSNGNLDCTGYNAYGQSNDYFGGDIIAVDNSFGNTCYLHSDLFAECVGWNAYGQDADYSGYDVMIPYR